MGVRGGLGGRAEGERRARARPRLLAAAADAVALPPLPPRARSYKGGRSVADFLKHISDSLAKDAGFARVDTLVPLAQQFLGATLEDKKALVTDAEDAASRVGGAQRGSGSGRGGGGGRGATHTRVELGACRTPHAAALGSPARRGREGERRTVRALLQEGAGEGRRVRAQRAAAPGEAGGEGHVGCEEGPPARGQRVCPRPPTPPPTLAPLLH